MRARVLGSPPHTWETHVGDPPSPSLLLWMFEGNAAHKYVLFLLFDQSSRQVYGLGHQQQHVHPTWLPAVHFLFQKFYYFFKDLFLL